MKTNNKQRLLEMMGKLDKTFKPTLNETFDSMTFSSKNFPNDLTLEQTVDIANKVAEIISMDGDGNATVNMNSIEPASFDLDLNGEEYAGGSYNIYDNGDVVNVAIREKPIVYNWKNTKNISEISDEGGEVSDLTVLRSAAGFYIGRTQDYMPYSRDSDYFPNKEAAQAELDKMNSKGGLGEEVNDEEGENYVDDMGTKASIVVMSHLSDAQAEMSFKPKLADVRLNFIKFIINKLSGNLNQYINPDKLFKDYTTRFGIDMSSINEEVGNLNELPNNIQQSSDKLSDIKNKLETIINNSWTNIGNSQRLIGVTLNNNSSLPNSILENPRMLNKTAIITIDNKRGIVYINMEHPMNAKLIDINIFGSMIKNKMTDCEVGWSGFTIFVQPK